MEDGVIAISGKDSVIKWSVYKLRLKFLSRFHLCIICCGNYSAMISASVIRQRGSIPASVFDQRETVFLVI